MQNIYVIDWQDDFLEELKNFALGQQVEEQIFVFPNARTKQYYTQVYAKHYANKNFVMPKLYSYDEFISHLHLIIFNQSYAFAEKFDSIALLFECSKELSAQNKLKKKELEDFYAWAIKLADLYEDYAAELINPQNILHLEGEIAPFATELLQNIQEIFNLYQQKLTEKKLSTKATYIKELAEYFLNNEAIPDYFKHKSIFFAGFYDLDKAQNIIFKHFFQAGAYYLISSDINICSNEKDFHWSCAEHLELKESWQAKFIALSECTNSKVQNIHYFAGYDLHSQLIALHSDLQNISDSSQNALVLTNPESLLPALHYIPEQKIKNINISLGYPLKNTLLHRLILNIISLQKNRNNEQYYWKDLLNLCTHPYLKKLDNEFTESLAQAENFIRTHAKFLDLELLLNKVDNANFTQLITLCIKNWENINTTAQMAQVLVELGEFLTIYGKELWEKDKLNSEYLFNLIHNICPKIAYNLLAEQQITKNTLLFNLLLELIENTNVQFEYDKNKINDLQVIGFLETRLLNFKHVFWLDLSSDNMPRLKTNDALMPDSLKKIIGLPDVNRKQMNIAYNFFSSIKKSENIYLYWQEGVENKGDFADKKQRSRYIEELIWQAEKEAKQIFKLGEDPLRLARVILQSQEIKAKGIEKTQVIQEKISEFLSTKNLSATVLDKYMRCPLMFYHQYICKLSEEEMVSEEDDFAALGDAIHSGLFEYFKQFLNQEITNEDLNSNELMQILYANLEKENIQDKISPTSYLMLSQTLEYKIYNYISNHAQSTKIIALEKEYSIKYKNTMIKACIDRIDERENKTIILDYKTGNIPKIKASFWQETDFFDKLKMWDNNSEDLLAELYKKMPSIQLALYMYLYYKNTGVLPSNASYVALGASSDEKAMFKTECEAIILEDYVPIILDFLFKHLTTCSSFTANQGRHCEFCPYQQMCTELPD